MGAIRKKVFSPAELAYARKEIIKARLGLDPVDAQPDGFYYDGPALLQAIKKKVTKKKQKSRL